jgi:RNA polymerase sigma factor (sigma-70 family)
MATGNLSAFLRRVARAMAAETLGDRSDRQLVEGLLRGRDEAAFEALVRRHGSMVYRVCWRILQHGQDAEDSFQATFLLLARKLATVRKHDSLASWLHGAARRAALKARAQAATRRRHERQIAIREVTPSGDPSWLELRTVLDTELAALPEKWRLPLILCYLEGRTQDEAAAQLKWSKSTIRRRLDEARAALGRRLARRGVSGSAALCGPLLSDCMSSASVSPNLASVTVDAGVQILAGQSAADLVSTNVIALTEGVIRAMFLTKLRIVAVFVVTVALGVCSLAIAMDASTTSFADPPSAPTAAARADERGLVSAQPGGEPAQSSKGKILVWHDSHYVFRTPDGKDAGELPDHPDKLTVNQPMLSPDGKRVAFTVNGNPVADDDGNIINRHVFVRALDGKDPGFKIDMNALNVAWAPDGKKLVVVEPITARDPKDGGFNTWLVDVATKEKTALDLSRWTHAFGMTPDGKSLVAAVYDFDARKINLAIVGRDGKKITTLTEVRTEGADPRLSPDGTLMLFQDLDSTEKAEKDMHRLPRLFVCDLKTKKRQRLLEAPAHGQIMSYCWSPNGKQVAYTWRQAHPGVPRAENTKNMDDPKLNTETESQLVIADADGKNARTVMSARAPRATTITIGPLDWR